MEQLKLNMIPNGVNPVFHASQYDKGRQIRFVLDETLSGAEVTVSYRAKDGTEHGNVQTSVSGNTITDTIPEEVLTDYGIIEGEVNIDGIGSLNFFVEVEKDAYDGGVITTQTASGAIATFETNIETAFVSLKSEINPVQDLHGYSKPWSGGGGKNKYCDIFSQYTQPNDYRVFPITLTQGQTYKLWASLKGSAVSGCVVAIVKDGTQYSNFVGFTQLITSNGSINTVPSFTVDATFTNPKLVVYAITETAFNSIFANYNVQLEVGNQATAYEPYSNICPISGFSALNVTRTGVNLWDEDWEVGDYDASTGAKKYPASKIRNKTPIFVNPNANYRVVPPSTANGLNIFFYDKNGDYINYYECGSSSNFIFTTPANCGYVNFSTFGSSTTTYNNDISINYPSSDTEYHAYNGQTATVNFGQTVYGGSLDVANGKVTITHGIVDLGTLNWLYNSTQQVFNATIDDIYNRTSGTENDALCSNYASENVWNASYLSNGCFMIRGDISRLYIKDTNYTDGATFKTAMSGVMFVYALATPIEIDTTPENLTAIVGVNNVYSDTGDTTVEYYIEV